MKKTFIIAGLLAILAGFPLLLWDTEHVAETVDVTLRTPTARATAGLANPYEYNAMINDFINNDHAIATAIAVLWDYSKAAARQTPSNDLYAESIYAGQYDADEVDVMEFGNGELKVMYDGNNSPIGAYKPVATTPAPGFYGSFEAGVASYSVGWVGTGYWRWLLEFYDEDWYACLYDYTDTTPTPMLVVNMTDQYGEIFGERFPASTPTPNAYTPLPSCTPYTPIANPYIFPGVVKGSRFVDDLDQTYYIEPYGTSFLRDLGCRTGDDDNIFVAAGSTGNVSMLGGLFGGYSKVDYITSRTNSGTATPLIQSLEWSANTPTPLATIVAGQFYGMNFGEYTGGDKVLYYNSADMRVGYDDPAPTVTPPPTPTPYTGICPLYYHGDQLKIDGYLDYAMTSESSAIIPVALYIYGLCVGLADAPGGEKSATYTIHVNSTPVPLSVTISDSATYGSTSATTPIPVTPGAELGVYMDEIGGITSTEAHAWITGQ